MDGQSRVTLLDFESRQAMEDIRFESREENSRDNGRSGSSVEVLSD
jgi:hypothetical protein